ncbi:MULTISPECIES: hypothetical protein [unclassified Streptomyces]|uniref:hypothetical protein n=1 Tax=unclassified Streptomyces TaxID=2593676 RepID=UPI000B1010D0|nr:MULTISPECIES: hypothetical protein [unclassified Streptomyces]
MAGDLQFTWELVGVGGVTYRIDDGVSEHETHIGYCTDALADLLYAMTGLYGDSSGERFSFDREPMETRWLLRRQGVDVAVDVFEFPDGATSWGSLDETGGVLLWSSTQPRSVLCHAVVEAVEVVLREHGETGYQEKWVRHPFPVAALQDLRRLHRRDDECGRCQSTPDS